VGYREDLAHALASFRETRRATDRAYLEWRNLHHGTLRAHRELRLLYADARQHCIEWGLEDHPDRFISYIDQEDTQAYVEEMIEYLENVEDLGDDWVKESIAALRRGLSAAREAAAQEDEKLSAYRQAVRARKVGYEHAYDAVLDFFKAVKSTVEPDSPDFFRFAPHYF
jgi:hypothetical protein